MTSQEAAAELHWLAVAAALIRAWEAAKDDRTNVAVEVGDDGKVLPSHDDYERAERERPDLVALARRYRPNLPVTWSVSR